MKIKSIKFNFIVNNLRLLMNLMFPLITFPYVSRILLTEGIGKIAFSQSVINYFLLLANLGIPLYGIREVAKVREKKEALSKVVSEILYINLIFVLLSYLLFIVFFCKLNIFQVESDLFLIMSLSILFTSIGIEWFYQGIEQYGYITIRSIIVKIFSIVLMFLFVKEKSDYIIWAGITVLSLIGSNIFNLINTRKYIHFTFRDLNVKRHIKPIMVIFFMNLAISIYTNLDATMLGIYSNNSAVGIYSASIKLNKIILTLATSLGAVAIPRLSYYLQKKDYSNYYKLGNKSINFIIFMTLPSIIGLYLLAPELIRIFSGRSFIEAVTPMRIMLPIIIIIAFTNFIGIQILYPNNQEKKIMYSVIVGAVINFTLNYLLIPKFSYNGAAIATVIGESCVLITQIILGKKYLKFELFSKSNIKFVCSAILMSIILLFSKKYFYLESNLLEVLKQVVLGIVSYGVFLIILREENTKKIILKLGRKN